MSLTLPLKINLDRVHLSDEQFYQLCLNNPDLALERTPEGILLLMAPVGGDTGNRELELGVDVGIWNRQQRSGGKVFSSSTLFKLPGGGDRSPDVAWVELSRWNALTPEQRQKFPPIAPDFVIELRQSDDLATLQAKMQEYRDSGVKLGWLFNPQDQEVEIYRLGQEKEVRSLPTQLSGEDVLVGFVLDVPRFEG